MKLLLFCESELLPNRINKRNRVNNYLSIVVLGCDDVEVKQGLVDVLLQVEGGVHSVQPGAPVVAFRSLDVLEHDATAALVLELHQLLGVGVLLRGLLHEVRVEASQGHVVTVEVVGLQLERQKKGWHYFTWLDLLHLNICQSSSFTT